MGNALQGFDPGKSRRVLFRAQEILQLRLRRSAILAGVVGQTRSASLPTRRIPPAQLFPLAWQRGFQLLRLLACGWRRDWLGLFALDHPHRCREPTLCGDRGQGLVRIEGRRIERQLRLIM